MNNYKYQGQELQDELGLGWYSFKWRNYNPEIARFMSIDPLAEKYAYQTPYQFASNQPVHANEIEGLENRNDLNLRQTTSVTRDRIPQTGLNRTIQLARSTPRITQTIARNTATISQGSTSAQYRLNEANAASLETARNTVSNHDNLGSPYTQNSVMVGAAYGVAGEATGLVAGELIGAVKGAIGLRSAANIATAESTLTQLQGVANEASAIVGEGSGAVHGTKVHTQFSKLASEIEGIFTEVSYKDGQVVPYGTKGSVRADAVEGSITSPSNVYDLKTGGAKLTTSNISKYNQHVPGSPNVTEIKPQ